MVSSLAKVLAQDIRNGNLWPGEGGKQLSQIREALDKASREINKDRGLGR